MGDRWISYSEAVKIVEKVYNDEIIDVFPDVIINKSTLQKFEKLVEEVLEHNLLDEKNSMNNLETRNYFYATIFLVESKLGLLKKINKQYKEENLNFLNESVSSTEFQDTIKADDDFSEMLDIYMRLITNDQIEIIVNLEKLIVQEALNLYSEVKMRNYFLDSKIKNNKIENEINENKDIIEELNSDSNLEELYSHYVIDTSHISLNIGFYILLKLKVYTMTNNLLLKKQYIHYSIFSKLPLVNPNGSVRNIIRMSGLYHGPSLRNKLASEVRKYQRKVKDNYKLFEKIVITKYKISLPKNSENYFVQLHLLDIVSNRRKMSKEYVKILNNITKLIRSVIENKDILYGEWEFIHSYFIYKSYEYYLKDKTFDFMKLRLIAESRCNEESIERLSRKLQEEGINLSKQYIPKADNKEKNTK